MDISRAKLVALCYGFAKVETNMVNTNARPSNEHIPDGTRPGPQMKSKA